MLEIFALSMVLNVALSRPLYRLEPNDSPVPTPEPRELIQTAPRDDQSLPTVNPLSPITVTEIIPTEEMKKVVPPIVLDRDFNLEITGTEGETNGPREKLVDSLSAGKMELIRKPAPIIDTAVEATKIKITASPTITTSEALPVLVDTSIDVLNEDEEHRPINERFNTAIDDELDDVKPNEITDEATSQIDEEDDEMERPISKIQEEPCDGPKVPMDLVRSDVVPAEVSKMTYPLDEESLFRIAAYLLSILSDPAESEPSVWQKIIAGVQCVLRNCREALPLRPTNSFPLDESHEFIIRRARDSYCPCALLDVNNW